MQCCFVLSVEGHGDALLCSIAAAVVGLFA
jgi:hypothetical protein